MYRVRGIASVVLLALAGCGGGDDGGSTGGVPAVSLTADRTTVFAGQSVNLSWSGSGSCVANEGWSGSKPASGTETVIVPAGSSVYAMTCSNDAGASAPSTVTIAATAPAVTGVLLAPDGQTPVAGATIYVPTIQPAALGKLRANRKNRFVVAGQSKPGDCAAPLAANAGFTCTEADGSFTLTVSAVQGDNIPLIAEKGMFRLTQSLAVAAQVAAGNLVLPSTVADGAPRIAVVTGFYDEMEVILAKLGLANYDAATDEIDAATAAFTLFDGAEGETEPTVNDLFAVDPATSRSRLYNYDVVFFNCGSNTNLLEEGANRAALRAYVEQGGVVYATDFAYDFIEQSMPEFLRFIGETDDAPQTPLGMFAAEQGPGDIMIDAAIQDEQLVTWLDTVSCTNGACRQSDGSIRVEGFLSGWAVLEGAHAAHADVVAEYVRGTVPMASNTTERPLSVTFTAGAGQVIFSSYHTVHGGEVSQGFYPQERVLQYLVFEAGE